MLKKLKPFIVSVVIALAVGGISAAVTSGSMDIYSEINRPPLSPPSILFPIVWTVLFTLMGISAALVYRFKDTKHDGVRTALIVYGVNLAVNFIWSLIFFNMQAYLFAFIWILLLLAVIVAMIILFKRISPLAAYLQIPYLLWVAFAAYLNFAIYLLNR
ncbi:MAG: tryptophan-rich sensory protein [Clostridia bacterium]|nr:tryptophan-rich sensory protein [Clostridia bacterium]